MKANFLIVETTKSGNKTIALITCECGKFKVIPLIPRKRTTFFVCAGCKCQLYYENYTEKGNPK